MSISANSGIYNHFFYSNCHVYFRVVERPPHHKILYESVHWMHTCNCLYIQSGMITRVTKVQLNHSHSYTKLFTNYEWLRITSNSLNMRIQPTWSQCVCWCMIETKLTIWTRGQKGANRNWRAKVKNAPRKKQEAFLFPPKTETVLFLTKHPRGLSFWRIQSHLNLKGFPKVAWKVTPWMTRM